MTTRTQAPLKLYRFALSGHSHRAQLMLSLLGLEHELVKVDRQTQEHKSPAFLKLNPFGQVPVLDDNGVIVADSNAILIYLALKYGNEQWLPRDPQGAAQVQRWLSVAAGPLASGPAAARAAKLFGFKIDIADATARAQALFAVMEQTLRESPFLCGSQPTVADVSLYTYTAHAPEGDVFLSPYPAIETWLARIRALPGFVPMASSAPSA